MAKTTPQYRDILGSIWEMPADEAPYFPFLVERVSEKPKRPRKGKVA